MKIYTKKILNNSDKYIIFYYKWCGYSMKAIDLLKQKKVPFKGYIINNEIAFLKTKFLKK